MARSTDAGSLIDLLVSTPLDVARALAESAQALAALPATLERTLRDTNLLIDEARQQLVTLSAQVERMTEQLDKMVAITDGLVDGARSIAAVAGEAERQIGSTGQYLAATNRTLEQIVRLAEPLDRLGKRLGDGLQRLTGRSGGE
jgi:methyl-accepting chemotaxis protein